jgi:hypothetical protein
MRLFFSSFYALVPLYFQIRIIKLTNQKGNEHRLLFFPWSEEEAGSDAEHSYEYTERDIFPIS